MQRKWLHRHHRQRVVVGRTSGENSKRKNSEKVTKVLTKDPQEAREMTVRNRRETRVCVWVDLADCLYTRLKIESDSQLPTIPLLSR